MLHTVLITRTNHFILLLQIRGARPHQKSGTILVTKGGLELNLPKDCYHKKCAPKLLFIIEKKIRKIPVIFEKENSL